MNTKPLPRAIEKRVEAKIARAAALLDEAFELARDNGWPNPQGFMSGEGYGVGIWLIAEDRLCEKQNAGPKNNTQGIGGSVAEHWECGAW